MSEQVAGVGGRLVAGVRQLISWAIELGEAPVFPWEFSEKSEIHREKASGHGEEKSPRIAAHLAPVENLNDAWEAFKNDGGKR